jgi:hypothetical protein
MKNSISLCAGLVVSVAGVVDAGAAPADTAVSWDAHGAAVVRAPHGEAVPAQAMPRAAAAGSVIYSTFSTGTGDPYDCCSGWAIAAAGAGVGFESSLAMPFTPAADTTLKKVHLALGWITGANLVDVSLQEDANGLPGRVIRQLELDTLYPFGDCCTTEVLRGKGPLLKAGHTYWIAVRATADTYAAWNQSNTGATGTIAYDPGTGWTTFESAQGGFAVIGE